VAVTDTLGDTIVVRTVAGSAWRAAELELELLVGRTVGADHEMFGEIRGLAVAPSGDIYVYDHLVPAIRKFGPDGTYLRTLGRGGGGPGEYKGSDGGIAVLADGRLLLRDPGNGRFTVFGSDGQYLEAWPGPRGVTTITPPVAGTHGGFLTRVLARGSSAQVARHAGDGSVIDTVPIPIREVAVPNLEARTRAGALQTLPLPLSPSAIWAMNRDGEWFTAVTGHYEVDRWRTDGTVLRVALDRAPVPLSPEERAAERERAADLIHRLVDPGWQWTGPPIPEIKPVLRRLYGADDGRLWVLLHQPGLPLPQEPGPDGRPRPAQFREPVVFDVFDADGRYLGEVRAPEGFALIPEPVFRSEYVWAVVLDELDVHHIARYRLVTRGHDTGITDGDDLPFYLTLPHLYLSRPSRNQTGLRKS
jgi:hypothetical protein